MLGDPALRNVISANAGPGVWLAGGASSNSILSNLIGTDPSGGAARANASGVVVTGPSNVLNGNVISGNTGPGVSVSGFGANGNILSSNVIGLSLGASAVVGNGGARFALSEGPNFVFLGNAIAGNGGDGIWVSASSNVIRENYIGTNASGTGGLGNVGNGHADPV